MNQSFPIFAIQKAVLRHNERLANERLLPALVIVSEFSLSSRINAIKEYVAESSSRSKQYMPRKFAEMSSKFRFGQEFVEKLGISSNLVDRSLHCFCTILYLEQSSWTNDTQQNYPW